MSQVEPANPDVVRLPLKSMGLRTGMALQTRRLVEGASKRESQYFGAIEGKGVMVGPLGSDAMPTELTEGEVCVVRGFTGQYEFSFLSKVLQTFEKPFVYALLAYPAQVDARQVRQSMRTKTSCPTWVRLPSAPNAIENSDIEVTLVDISVAGAMIKAPVGIAAIGDVIHVKMEVNFENSPITLQLTAAICHNNKTSAGDGYFIGMAFKNLSQNDKLVLHYMTQTPQN
jgi:c-di-GMP-binding flagellar brake protein YcgR